MPDLVSTPWFKPASSRRECFRLEDSQLTTADGLLKLTAVAALAACTTLQLVQARNGKSAEHCSVAFTSSEIQSLEKLRPRLEELAAAQKTHIIDVA